MKPYLLLLLLISTSLVCSKQQSKEQTPPANSVEEKQLPVSSLKNIPVDSTMSITDNIQNGYVLYYMDNQGNCLVCNQMRILSQVVLKQRFKTDWDAKRIARDFVILRSKKFLFLSKICNAYPGSLVLAKIKNSREVNYVLLRTRKVVLNINDTQKCFDILEQEIHKGMQLLNN